MFSKKLGLIIGLCVLIAGCSTGGMYNSYYMSGPTSKTDKGMRYLTGRGAPQSNTKAFATFSEAANEGDAFAQNELAYMYAAGKGTSRNYGKALFWYKKAANHGLASAQYNLGLLYLHGLGTQPNKALAQKWLQQSAALGFEPARNALAKMS